MLQPQISHSPDLKRLWEEGYELEIKGALLLVHHIPYLNQSLEIKYGTLVAPLALVGNMTGAPPDHTAYFIGEAPCRKDGQVMLAIICSSGAQTLADGITADHYLSSKPSGGNYPDYFEKIVTYANAISAPAKSLDGTVTEKTYKVVVSDEADSVFHYPDTNSARAGIDGISSGIRGQRVAIVGLGGTGSYILDLLAKTPVATVHLYDGDIFMQNNAFRAPGAPTVDMLRSRPMKADYFAGIYSAMHRHIVAHPYYVDAGNITELEGYDFVFLCIDRGGSKRLVVDFLEARNIPFIDVGMGVQRVEDQLLGILRVTASTALKRDHINRRITFTEGEANEYATNIQIAELNALNATMAVIKWKKLYGFYQDFEQENHATYSINVNQLLSDDHAA